MTSKIVRSKEMSDNKPLVPACTAAELRDMLKKNGTLDMPVFFETWDASNLVVLSVYEHEGAIHIDIGGTDDGLLDLDEEDYDPNDYWTPEEDANG